MYERSWCIYSKEDISLAGQPGGHVIMFYLPKNAGRKHTDVTYDVGSVHYTPLSLDFSKDACFSSNEFWGELLVVFILVHCRPHSQHHKPDLTLVKDVTRQRRTERETQIWHLHGPCLHFPIFSISCRAQEVISTQNVGTWRSFWWVWEQLGLTLSLSLKAFELY